MNVLIVDDKEENRYLLETLLKAKSYNVLSASNGEEALEKIKDHSVDLIISDILMPVMDGFQLCRKIKTDKALCHIPFIIYTATYTGPKDEEFAMKIGADRFIQKPCEPDVFMEAVQDVMASTTRRNNEFVPKAVQEEEILKLYSERLVRKLEQKMLELEKEVQSRKEAEEILRESERKYRLLTDNTLDIIWVMDLELTFTYVNPAIQNLMGYTPEEWVGTRLQDQCDEENFARIVRVIASEKAKGPDSAGIILETDLLNKNREPIPFEVHGRVIFDEKGEPIGLQGVARGISERKQAEKENQMLQEQLLQAQKLEAIGRLTSGIAHDFNNVLTAIIGTAEIILMRMQKSESDRTRRDIEDIKAAGNRAAILTHQLLAFSRKQILQPRIIDLNETVNNMQKMLHRIIGEDIELVTVLPPDLGAVEADEGQIEQIIMNLAVNSRDAMLNGGKLTIETANMDLDEEYAHHHIAVTPGPHVMLSVSDTGVGMTSEVLEHLFEPFYTTKEKGKGTGLGLSTVYGIVKQSKGNIWVYSEPGKGTTFKVYLPIVEKLKGAAKKDLKPKVLTGSETILIVEDDEKVRTVTVRILKGYGYIILIAADGQEAIRLSENHEGSIHLMLTDVVMPDMSGGELEKRLKASRPDMKVIFMSGYTDNAIVHQGILDQDKAFIQKPFTPDSLARKVRELLDKSSRFVKTEYPFVDP
ncbi:MAG: response regulator [Deltaproteobacteria bacterium]|nr:response regulator [Deltaproteobacteria bacterium]